MTIPSLLESALYSLYTRRLLKRIRQGPLPRHVALILDGNRRFARRHGLESPSAGHQLGAEKVDELLEWCDELSIPVVTVWALSMDNLRRQPEEVGELLQVIESKIKALTQAQPQHRFPRSIHVLGRLEVLPASIRDVIADAEVSTAHLGPLRLNIALGYDGREEITQAVRDLLLEQAEKETPLRDVANELTSEGIAREVSSEGV